MIKGMKNKWDLKEKRRKKRRTKEKKTTKKKQEEKRKKQDEKTTDQNEFNEQIIKKETDIGKELFKNHIGF